MEFQQLAIANWPRTRDVQADRAAYGIESIDYGLIRMGEIKNHMGGYAAADSLFQTALVNLERALGADHPSTVRASLFLGDFYLLSLRVPARAEAIFRTALARLEATSGDQHRNLIHPRESLSLALSAQGHQQESIDLRRTVLEHGRQDLGPDGPIDTIRRGRAEALGHAGQDLRHMAYAYGRAAPLQLPGQVQETAEIPGQQGIREPG